MVPPAPVVAPAPAAAPAPPQRRPPRDPRVAARAEALVAMGFDAQSSRVAAERHSDVQDAVHSLVSAQRRAPSFHTGGAGRVAPVVAAGDLSRAALIEEDDDPPDATRGDGRVAARTLSSPPPPRPSAVEAARCGDPSNWPSRFPQRPSQAARGPSAGGVVARPAAGSAKTGAGAASAATTASSGKLFGVYYHPQTNKYQARIRNGGPDKSLG
jgi:hypothetical protein